MIYLAERNLFTDCSKLLWNREKSPAGLVRLLVWRLKFVALKFLAPNDTRVSVHFVSQSSLSSISFLFVGLFLSKPFQSLPVSSEGCHLSLPGLLWFKSFESKTMALNKLFVLFVLFLVHDTLAAKSKRDNQPDLVNKQEEGKENSIPTGELHNWFILCWFVYIVHFWRIGLSNSCFRYLPWLQVWSWSSL